MTTDEPKVIPQRPDGRTVGEPRPLLPPAIPRSSVRAGERAGLRRRAGAFARGLGPGPHRRRGGTVGAECRPRGRAGRNRGARDNPRPRGGVV